MLEDLKIVQYFFYRQWIELRTYCRKKGVRIFGDLPIYVPFHSADVWAHPQLFKLDDTGSPVAVSGVPPDYFSTDGQLWGHPVYRWDVHRDTRYEWWLLPVRPKPGLVRPCPNRPFSGTRGLLGGPGA